jgi:hypothetical protein
MLSDPETNSLKEQLTHIIKEYNADITVHDFRVVKGNTRTNVIFDAVIPFNLKNAESDIRKLVDGHLATYDKVYYAVIEFDRNFNE